MKLVVLLFLLLIPMPSPAQPFQCRADIHESHHSCDSYMKFAYHPRKYDWGKAKCENCCGGFRCVDVPHPPRMNPSCNLVTGEGKRIDGCSGGGHAEKQIFHFACTTHDICYNTIDMEHKPGGPNRNTRSKDKCDSDFKKNMEEACDLMSEDPTVCKNTAHTMYDGVRNEIAKVAFLKGQQWAAANCIDGIGIRVTNAAGFEFTYQVDYTLNGKSHTEKSNTVGGLIVSYMNIYAADKASITIHQKGGGDFEVGKFDLKIGKQTCIVVYGTPGVGAAKTEGCS